MKTKTTVTEKTVFEIAVRDFHGAGSVVEMLLSQEQGALLQAVSQLLKDRAPVGSPGLLVRRKGTHRYE